MADSTSKKLIAFFGLLFGMTPINVCGTEVGTTRGLMKQVVSFFKNKIK
jgi:hypothetical protein